MWTRYNQNHHRREHNTVHRLETDRHITARPYAALPRHEPNEKVVLTDRHGHPRGYAQVISKRAHHVQSSQYKNGYFRRTVKNYKIFDILINVLSCLMLHVSPTYCSVMIFLYFFLGLSWISEFFNVNEKILYRNLFKHQ